MIENIPPSALLDRMELIQLDGYTEDDKVAIARDYLLPPRQRDRAALTPPEEVTVTDEALRKIAADYTREPGVRQFERLLAKALRKATTKLAASDEPLTIDEPDLVGYLAVRASPRSRPNARRCRVWRPDWPSRDWVAMFSTSKPGPLDQLGQAMDLCS